MDSLLDAVKKRWDLEDVPTGPDVSDADLNAFERKYGVVLPPDLRTYFLKLNGSAYGQGGPMDNELLSFWNLAELRPLPEEYPPANFPGARSYFGFADYSVWCYAYAVRLSADPAAPTPVVLVHDRADGADIFEVAPSFTAFMTAYLRRDQRVLHPDAPMGPRSGD